MHKELTHIHIEKQTKAWLISERVHGTCNAGVSIIGQPSWTVNNTRVVPAPGEPVEYWAVTFAKYFSPVSQR